MTYSEIRSAYEIAETFDREVYIGIKKKTWMNKRWWYINTLTGSTHIITPDKFVQDLSILDKKLPAPKSVVPPYTGSIHQSTNNTKTPPPRTAASLANNPKGSHKILGKW
jgi:hypothetical protein